jgi:hypothetical protein
MVESKFQTVVTIPPFKWETGYSKKNLFMGSCFTENVGKQMADLNYDIDINPFGILYNPISVANGLEILLQQKKFSAKDLIQHNGLWHSFFHHGRFSSPDKNLAIDTINRQLTASSEYLKNADFLFITFGTSWIYKYKLSDKTVSNCHKIPANEFERIRLSVDEIVGLYNKLLDKIHDVNPGLKIIFTVSPVRHWKDGAIGNQRSKATLLLAVEEIVQTNNKYADYFPSYEIMMDELRDYRFYSEDMIHISDAAVNHIWERFESALISGESQTISRDIRKIKTAISHRPFNKFTKKYLYFLQKQLSDIKHFELSYPIVNLELEKQYFIDLINEIETNLLSFND